MEGKSSDLILWQPALSFPGDICSPCFLIPIPSSPAILYVRLAETAQKKKKRAEPVQGMTGVCGAGRKDGTTAASTQRTVCCGFGAARNSCCLYPACTVLPPLFGSSPALLSSSRSQRDHVRMAPLLPGLIQLSVASVSRWENNLTDGSTGAIKNMGSFGWGAPSCIYSGCSYPYVGFFTSLRGWTSFFHQQNLLHPLAAMIQSPPSSRVQPLPRAEQSPNPGSSSQARAWVKTRAAPTGGLFILLRRADPLACEPVAFISWD